MTFSVVRGPTKAAGRAKSRRMNVQSGRDRVLATFACAPVDRLPIWLMRQAGRYLPEYRELRARMSFLELCHSAEACTEVALQPLRRFPLDATIVFSDILTVLDAAGAGLRFVTGDGPSLASPVRTPADAARLDWTDMAGKLGFTYRAVSELRLAAPDHALFGFAGSPWTLFCYLVEGQGSSDFAKARTFARQFPDETAALLNHLADAVADHLNAQIDAGADAVQVFDTWGGLLSGDAWRRLSLPGLVRVHKRVLERHPAARTMLFVRAGHLVQASLEAGYRAISLHDTAILAEARLPGMVTQGNVDNTCLLAGPDAIRAEVRRLERDLKGETLGHIVNLGHGILPSTAPEAVSALCEAVARILVSDAP